MQETTNNYPLPNAVTNPVAPDPVQIPQVQQIEVHVKKGISFKIIGFITIIFLLIVCIATIALAIPYLKNNFVPGISPITESITSSPSEQVASRITPYISTGTKAIDQYTDDPTNILDKFDFSGMPITLNTVGLEYEINYNKKNTGEAENLSEDFIYSSFLESFVDGEDVSLIMKGEGKSNYKSPTNMQSDLSLDMSIINDGITAEGSMNIKTNNNDVYFNINSIPDMGIMNMETLVGKWYSINQSDFIDTVNNINSTDSISNIANLTKIKDYLLGSKELFYKPTLEKNVKLAGEETYHGITIKCYSVALSKSGIISLSTDINTLIKDPANQINLTENDLDDFGELNIKLCFDKSSVIMNKFEMTLKSITTSSEFTYGFSLGMYDLGKKEEISMPSESDPINDQFDNLFIDSIEEVEETEETDLPELDYNPDMGY